MAGGLIGAGVGGLTGLIQHNQKQGEYNRQKQLAADIERNSAWTGVHGEMPKEAPNAFNSVLQGGLSGAMMGSPGGAFGGAMGAAAPAAAASPLAGMTQMGGKSSYMDMSPMDTSNEMPNLYAPGRKSNWATFVS
jgi:hypothetical protein